MDLPLFPLNMVFFPGQVQHLHVFEPRYREMINYCIEHKHPFGIVLIKESENAGGVTVPYEVGTAAQIIDSQRLEDGRLFITTRGTKRFRIDKINHERSYLTGEVRTFPLINGRTKKAATLAQRMRPRIVEYIETLARASNSKLPLKPLPENPTALAFLTAMALQIEPEEKQKILALPEVPQMLRRESYLLWREVALLDHQIATQGDVDDMTAGPTRYIFPN